MVCRVLAANPYIRDDEVDIGIRRDRAVKYVSDTRGTELNYRVVSDTICRMRASEPLSADWKAEIEADERKRGK